MLKTRQKMITFNKILSSQLVVGDNVEIADT